MGRGNRLLQRRGGGKAEARGVLRRDVLKRLRLRRGDTGRGRDLRDWLGRGRHLFERGRNLLGRGRRRLGLLDLVGA